MSWQVTRLSTWSSAGGVPLGDCGIALPDSEWHRELGEFNRGTLILLSPIAARWITAMAIVRVDRPGHPPFEARCGHRSWVRRGDAALAIRVDIEGRMFDLANSDTVFEVLNGQTIHTFKQALAPRAMYERFVFVRQDADNLTGLALGVVEPTEPTPLEWTRWSRKQLHDAQLAASVAECQLRHEDGLEYLDVLREVGADALPVSLAFSDRLIAHQLEEDTDDLMTVARVGGDAATAESELATIGEATWAVTGVRALAGGRSAVQLRAPGATESPILVSGMYATHPELRPPLPSRYLLREDGTTTEILASDAATSEVEVSGNVPLVDERVVIVADAIGTPLERLEHPVAMADVGYAARDLQLPGRGERNYLRNGGHEAGMARWSSHNGGIGVHYDRADFGQTFTALANGARAAGTGIGTLFAIDGAPFNKWLRKGDRMRVGGVVLPVTSDAIASTLGVLVLALGGGGLPGAYPDNTPLTLERLDYRQFVLDGDHSVFAAALRFEDSDTDHLYEATPGSLASLTGGFVGMFRALKYVTTPVRAGAIATTPPSGWPQTLDLGASGATVFAANFITLGAAGTGVSSAVFVLGTVTGGVLTVDVTRFRYIRNDSELQVVRVTAISGSNVTVVSESHATIGYPSAGLYDGGAGHWPFAACNDVIPDGTVFEATLVRETRTLYTNGSHSAGASPVTFKAQSVIARRDWVNTDTIVLPRPLTATMDVTAIVTIDEIWDDDDVPTVIVAYQMTVTFDTVTSDIDDADPADWASDCYFAFPAGGSAIEYWRLTGIVGSDATFFIAASARFGTPTTGLVDAHWTVYDTYAVSASASWGTNGRVTLTIPSVPAGRTYPRGELVWANWHTRASFGTASMLRLHAQLDPSDTTVEIGGQDAWVQGLAPLTPQPYAVYRVVGNGSGDASRIPIPGNELYVDASVQTSGAGAASVLLKAANPNAIADNELVTIERPAMVPVGESLTPGAMRLFCAVGGTGVPTGSTAGEDHELAYIHVPAGAFVSITVRALFTLSVGDWTPGQGPVVAIVDAAGTILGSGRLGDDGVSIEVAPGVVDVPATATLAASGWVRIRTYGGSSSDYSRWCVHLRSMLYKGTATDVPYTAESWGTRLAVAALARLTQQCAPRISDRLTIREWTDAQLAAGDVDPAGVRPVVMGGRVIIEPAAAGDAVRTARVVTISARLVQQEDSVVEDIEIGIGQPARDAVRQLAAAGVAAGAGGFR